MIALTHTLSISGNHIFVIPAGLALSDEPNTPSLYWDANGLTANRTDGAGTWTTANLWQDSLGANTNWVSNYKAVIGNGGAGGIIAITGPVTVYGITFNAYTGTYTLGTAGQTFNLSQGINKKSGTGICIIASNITLQNANWFLNNSTTPLNIISTLNTNGYSLTYKGTGLLDFSTNVNAVISGTGGITVLSGRVILGTNTVPAHTYSGPTISKGGVLQFANNIPANSNIVLNGGIIESYWTSGLTRTQGTGVGQIQVIGGISGFSLNANNSCTFNIGNMTWGSAYFNPSKLVLQSQYSQGTSVVTLAGTINLNGATRTILVNGGVTGGATGALSGVVSGNVGINKEGVGILRLSGLNTFTGPITVFAGSLAWTGTVVSSYDNNPLGRSSPIASNLILYNQTSITHQGSTATCDRLFTVLGSIGIANTGTGPITFSATGALEYGTVDKFRALTFLGTQLGNNIFAPVIADNGAVQTFVTKIGLGTWNLSGVNTYTGPTSITRGILRVTGSIVSASTINNAYLEGSNVSGGTATVGNVTINNVANSNLRAGTAGNNTLNTGNVTFLGTSSRLVVDCITGSVSKVNVTGDVTLAGVGVVINGTAGTGVWDVMVATGTISGAVNKISGTGTLAIDVTGKKLQLTVA